MTGYRPVFHLYSSSPFSTVGDCWSSSLPVIVIQDMATLYLTLGTIFNAFKFFLNCFCGAVLCLDPWFHKMIIVRGEGPCVHNVMYAANTERERPPSHYREKGTRASPYPPCLHCLLMTYSILVTGDVSSSKPYYPWSLPRSKLLNGGLDWLVRFSGH